MNALVSLLVPLVVLIGVSAAGLDARRAVPAVLTILALVGGFFVLFQVTTGSGPIYRVSYPTASGLFANQNHQALMLAIGIPHAVLWASHGNSHISPSVRFVIGGVTAVFLAGMIMVTGSRAGLVFGAIGIAALPFIVPARLWRKKGTRLGAAAAVGILVIFLGIIIAFDRSQSVTRLIKMSDFAEEGRLAFLPITLSILIDFLPFGAGMSVFDPLYRTYEPDWALHVGYYNRAHNDWLDLVLGGGLVAGALAIALVITLIRATRRGLRVRHQRRWVLAGTTALIQIGLASLVDYPLRTPLMAGVFTLLCISVLAPPDYKSVSSSWGPNPALRFKRLGIGPAIDGADHRP